MTVVPLWEILVASVYERYESLVGLLARLAPQLSPDVQVVVFRDGGDLEIGAKRTQLVQQASADYVCFVDDDDMVSTFYVPLILRQLATRPDYVGFNVAYTVDGMLQKPVHHDPGCGSWFETGDAYWRDVSHLNPIRRDIAAAALPFDGGFAEDQRWADRVRGSGLVRSWGYIRGGAVYEYRYSTSGSLFRHGPTSPAVRLPLPEIPYVSEIGDDLLDAPGGVV